MNKLTLLAPAILAAGLADAQPFDIEQQTIAGGGGALIAGSLALNATINPAAGGRLQAGNFQLTGGLFPLDRPLPDCPADANGDGLLLPNDFSAWIAAFNAQGPACDQNGDGLCLPNDFSAWIANFNAGCN
jgi:hypothetical protein